ncbi:uncharacterized protein LOC100905561 [Galendromus occidentalis]|uniref:Uncharacterized protein LOC100905561 n=1 Tax=Galendromus occidentalis TaxID=34638 RepID=A0AAJ6QPA9_9ACAR|nr:uncharacterized protein LOC100905561 [Galendromus occidentalis]
MEKGLQEILDSMSNAIKLLAENQAAKETSNSSALQNATSLLGTFDYRPEADQTFQRWFARHQTILEESTSSDKLRVQLLLKALGSSEYGRLRNRLSPLAPEAKSYPELVRACEESFGPTKSLFRRRYETLGGRAPPGTSAEDIMDWANIKGDEFELSNLKADTFKLFLALIYASDSSFKNFRAVILKTLEDKPEQSLSDVREVLRRFEIRTQDSALDAEVSHTNVNRITHTQSSDRSRSGPTSASCRSCGGPHKRQN